MFLGLDFGTSGVRACVLHPDKTIAWKGLYPYPDPFGQTHSDWRNALHSLLNSLPKHIALDLQGVAIDGTSGTVLLSDAKLNPCSPVLLYNDNRAQRQAVQLETMAPVNHIVCTATSGLAKFLWLIEQNHAEQAAYFLHQADWLTALISEECGTSDYHNALKTGFDVDQLCWPDWLLKLPYTRLLPKVLQPGESISRIRPEIASQYHINQNCIVHAGTTDSTAAFMASGTSEIGIGVTTLGTTLVLKQLSRERIESTKFGVYSHRYGDLWLVGGASNAGAGILRNYFDDAKIAALSKQIDPDQDSPLDYYPITKVGERFPINDPYLQPRLLPRPDRDAEFLHGLLQGLSRIEVAGYARLTTLGTKPLNQVITNGGGAKNPIWSKLRARLLGVPVSSAGHSEAAYGSALLCLMN